IRRIDAATGIITTVAGDGFNDQGFGRFSGDDGPATSASLNEPKGIALDGAGNLYITDSSNNRIRVVKGIGKVEGGGQGQVSITNAVFNKPNLTITGTGFGSSGTKVNVNGLDVSSLILSQTNTTI